ncbi:MAG: tRNA (adenosine(37)-N6)-dimethylallyltransferase MiaA [Clostridiales bacterium GWF2_38_85]|nr:MAG: tRNA (adenosine(37)-N6)-dimethylallyltransferase MiaA [Clostridiales bacterium GWF2_38_85]
MNHKIPIVVIAGATAVGKSEVAFELAKRIDGEIISGDSMQVYKGMDIGTAKPSKAEQTGVKHHLIDSLDINEPFSVRQFTELAKKAAEDIVSREKIPILAGGTGLYIEMLLNATLLPETESTASLREVYMTLAQTLGNNKLHEILRSVDEASAEKLHPNNVKRVVRALEVYHTTGKTIGEWNEQSHIIPSDFRPFMVYIKGSREWLYNRINLRVDKFIEQGLVDEVKALYDIGLEDTITASQSIGYKEFFPYFEGLCSLEEVFDQIKKATRNFAKRQETYFNRMKFDIELDGEEKRYEVKVNNVEKLLKTEGFCDII